MNALDLLSDAESEDDGAEPEEAEEPDAKRQKTLTLEALKRAGFAADAEEDERAAAVTSLSSSFSALEKSVKEQQKPLQPDLPSGTPIRGSDTTFEILKEGNADGKKVVKGCTATVHAVGVVKETGKQFWSTRETGRPHSYQAGVGKVIPGWDRGCLGMAIGEERKLTIPGHEGYGGTGFPAWGIPPHATLEFTLECIEIA
eukprot:gb/GFBE01053033.1/.p1 GENE.gb/GFBE01053033.1/~~gb/GFBE01053033.1/.p1  ORF type:complete len:201 (+),score=62.35 gb/GFBE01053033.1/:1-603(+)